MQNPYVLASIRKMQRDRALRLPAAQPDGWAPTGQMSAFLEACEIGHPGSRAKVCTGIANRLSDEELASLLAHMRAGNAAEAARLLVLNAHEVLVTNALRVTGPMLILERVLKKRAERRGGE